LVEDASKLPIPDLASIRLKKPSEFKLIGKPLPRKDIPGKADGSAIYGLDVRVPGMVYAVVARCPVFGGTVKSVDASKAKAMKGVIDVFEIPAVSKASIPAAALLLSRRPPISQCKPASNCRSFGTTARMPAKAAAACGASSVVWWI